MVEKGIQQQPAEGEGGSGGGRKWGREEVGVGRKWVGEGSGWAEANNDKINSSKWIISMNALRIVALKLWT